MLLDVRWAMGRRLPSVIVWEGHTKQIAFHSSDCCRLMKGKIRFSAGCWILHMTALINTLICDNKTNMFWDALGARWLCYQIVITVAFCSSPSPRPPRVCGWCQKLSLCLLTKQNTAQKAPTQSSHWFQAVNYLLFKWRTTSSLLKPYTRLLMQYLLTQYPAIIIRDLNSL